MVGVVRRGGTSEPLAPLGVPRDLALAPFAARYRLSDFAHATLRNSGIGLVGAASGGRVPAASRPASQPADPPRPEARLLASLRSVARLARTDPDEPVVVLLADRILDADLRPVLGFHHSAAADLALLCVPAAGAPEHACVLDPDASGTVHGASTAGAATDPLALAWTGDLIVRAGSLACLLSTLEERSPGDDVAQIAVLARAHRVVAHDVLTATSGGRRAYWHEPSSIEAYYGAHMDLCTDSPRLDLYDPGWPVLGTGEGLPPAKVVSGEGAHAGQALDALLGDGAVIRGGSVIRSVVGRSALVDVGAEIEDSLLLDGCRIGRGARVRRAVVGAGVVVSDGEQIGYDDAPCASAVTERRHSGLTLVLPAGATRRASAPR